MTITPVELSLWLLTDPARHAQDMAELIDSADLVIVADGETFTVVRTHSDVISRLETGSRLPLLPLTLA
jgi:hypothetical protein